MDNLYDISEGVAKRTINQPSITCDDVKINMDPTERLIGQYVIVCRFTVSRQLVA